MHQDANLRIMRTTITLEKDVAADLDQLQRACDRSFKSLVNEALREGIRAMKAPPQARRPFRTKAVDLGAPQFNSPQELKKLRAELDDDYDGKKLGRS